MEATFPMIETLCRRRKFRFPANSTPDPLPVNSWSIWR